MTKGKKCDSIEKLRRERGKRQKKMSKKSLKNLLTRTSRYDILIELSQRAAEKLDLEN